MILVFQGTSGSKFNFFLTWALSGRPELFAPTLQPEKITCAYNMFSEFTSCKITVAYFVLLELVS